MKTLKLLAAAVAVQAAMGSAAMAATFMPVGVQNDVAYSTVASTWGWDLLYRGDYHLQVPIGDVFGGAKKYIMIGAIKDGSLTIELLAATTTADFQTITAQSTSHLSNGAQWYYNSSSLGFAGADDTISQNSADVAGSTWSGGPINERDRLSWHTAGGATPTSVDGGWRAGSYTALNGSSEWDRVVFTTDSLGSAVPEPATWAMMIIGFGAAGSMVRANRRRNALAMAA
jgi:hypothetical protein